MTSPERADGTLCYILSGDSYHEFALVEAVLSGGEDGAAVGAAVLQGRIS